MFPADGGREEETDGPFLLGGEGESPRGRHLPEGAGDLLVEDLDAGGAPAHGGSLSGPEAVRAPRAGAADGSDADDGNGEDFPLFPRAA